MSELVEALRREEGRFREFEKAVERLRRGTKKGGELEGKAAELIKKARGEELEAFLSAIREILKLDPNLDPRHMSGGERAARLLLRDWNPDPLTIVRTVRRRGEELRRAIELLGALELPEPPPSTFSRDLDLEAEFPLEDGIRRVRVVRISLSLEGDGLPSGLWIEFESNGKRRRVRVEEFSDLPFLLPLHREGLELLGEVTRRYEEYANELEAFVRRFVPEHSRRILMASL